MGLKFQPKLVTIISMVASVTNPGALALNIASVQQSTIRAADKIDSAFNDQGAISTTAKFGPDPVTGSPFQIISGDDIRAAETNDLERLSEANLGRLSSQNSFQAQSVRSEQEFTAETEASRSDQEAQRTPPFNQSPFTQTSDVGVSDSSQRGNSVDLQI
jgi:hypothetical protein